MFESSLQQDFIQRISEIQADVTFGTGRRLNTKTPRYLSVLLRVKAFFIPFILDNKTEKVRIKRTVWKMAHRENTFFYSLHLMKFMTKS